MAKNYFFFQMNIAYHSTDPECPRTATFEEAIRAPIPSPGHLWVPSSLPTVTFPAKDEPFTRFLDIVMKTFAPNVWTAEMLESFNSIDMVVTEKQFNGRPVHELQLWHGKTQAFKDFGCEVAAILYQKLFTDKRVLVATSGDTGASVAQSFAARKGLRATVLYPSGKISAYQERQITRCDDPHHRILPVAVPGDFDRCQLIAKELLMRYPDQLVSANSISLARLLPQIAYHAWVGAQFKEPCTVVVPSGNMGNACAAIMGMRMGANIDHVHIACNENDSVARYLNGKDEAFRAKPTVKTPATAMDIGKPSNWVRLQYLGVGPGCDDVSASATKSEHIRPIRHELHVCPHTAIAYHALKACPVLMRAKNVVVVATASPVKFDLNGSPRQLLERCTLLKMPRLALPVARTIWLVGMPGSGKTTIARAMKGCDTDDLFNGELQLKAEGCETPAEFYLEEMELIVKYASTNPVGVVATGGSAVHRSEAVQAMRNVPNSIVVWLDCPLHTLVERCGDLSERGVVMPDPKMTFGQLMAYRKRLYSSAADIRIRTTERNTVESTVELLKALLE